jgi:hypothetical protein
MVLAGLDLCREPLEKRRAPLENKVLPKLTVPVHYTVDLDEPLPRADRVREGAGA